MWGVATAVLIVTGTMPTLPAGCTLSDSYLCASVSGTLSSSAGTCVCTATLPTGCTMTKASHCMAFHGTLESHSGTCVCAVTSWVPRVVTNASKGDLALVPLSSLTSPDDAAIKLTMSALAQNFSHSLIHLSQGEVVHATAVGAIDQDGFHLAPDDLMNATPGVVRTTIDWAHDHDRFADEGLVGKPASEVLRPLLEAAADEALLDVGSAFYKVADFTDNTGMSFGFSTDRSVNRRGTQCAGFVWEAFNRAGVHISRHEYPVDLRTDVAHSLWDGLFDLAPWPAKRNVANQVVNCFAGFNKIDGVVNCDDTSDTWLTSGVGIGTTVSPDNLLPVSFVLHTGSSGFTDTGLPGYEWTERIGSRTVVTSQKLPGMTVDSSSRCDAAGSCVSFGAPTTVFQRIELQNVVGGYYSTTYLTSF